MVKKVGIWLAHFFTLQKIGFLIVYFSVPLEFFKLICSESSLNIIYKNFNPQTYGIVHIKPEIKEVAKIKIRRELDKKREQALPP